ncbi:MAG: F0F1 ATP synthase subunit B' [Maricaulaceae bacterium]
MAAEKTHSSDVAHDAASGGLPQFDFTTWSSQITWLIIVFGLLYFILAKFVLPKLGTTITERGDRIADDLDAASRMQRDAEEAEKTYERSLADAKAKAHNVAESTRQSVNDEIAKELEIADADAAKQAEAADVRIKKIRNNALANIDAVASDTASEIVAKLLGKAPTKAQLTSAFKG